MKKLFITMLSRVVMMLFVACGSTMEIAVALFHSVPRLVMY